MHALHPPIPSAPCHATACASAHGGGGCFVKGTKVHTKDGKKPIEEIQIGDYVLSAPEDGSGEPEYKQVVNTFKYSNKRIWKIRYWWNHPELGNVRATIACTGNHPFWVEGVGWTRADELEENHLFRISDGSTVEVDSCRPVYRTQQPGIGWAANNWWDVDLQGTGIEHDYKNARLLPDGGGERYLDRDILYSDNPFLEVDVYNIEVEDHHTYYVSMGVWVHNRNCAGVELFNKKGFPKNLDPTTPLYTDAKELEADIAAGASEQVVVELQSRQTEYGIGRYDTQTKISSRGLTFFYLKVLWKMGRLQYFLESAMPRV